MRRVAQAHSVWPAVRQDSLQAIQRLRCILRLRDPVGHHEEEITRLQPHAVRDRQNPPRRIAVVRQSR